MKKLNPAFFKAIVEKVNTSPYYALTSMEIKNLSWGECLMQLLVQEKHLQPYGMAHGGVYAALVDAASYWAVFTQINEGFKMITIDLKLNYLASASEGALLAKGKSIKVGKTLCMGETSISDENGKLLSHGTSTMMVLKDLQIKGEFQLPIKYVD